MEGNNEKKQMFATLVGTGATTPERHTSCAAASTTCSPCATPSSPDSGSRPATSPTTTPTATPACSSRRAPTSSAHCATWCPARRRGGVLFFHYSGHGTLVPPHRCGHGHVVDEAIVSCDFNLITDVDFRQLVERARAGGRHLHRGVRRQRDSTRFHLHHRQHQVLLAPPRARLHQEEEGLKN
ncbi:unnamed protein product [Urochloa humidicola]